MKIERINENTLKFYISYLDIEDRGFDREEIWYNRDRSEELFWQMMDEAHRQESFSLEGPLWIQVQALEKGMEIIVTRAQLSQDGTNVQLPISADKHVDIPVSETTGKYLNRRSASDGEEEEESSSKKQSGKKLSFREGEGVVFVIHFADIEDVIALSHSFETNDEISTTLYVYKGGYYLETVFSDSMPDELQDDNLSKLLEYGLDTNVTTFLLQEYGKCIIEKQALQTIKKHFSTNP